MTGLPAGITPTTVTMKLLGDDGTPATGTVSFTPSKTTWIEDVTDSAILLPVPVVGTLDSTGSASVSLVPTNSSVISPTGWTYDVAINVKVGNLPFTQAYSVSIPSSPSTVDLSALEPVSADGNGGTKVVLSVNTQKPDAGGNVTLTAAEVGALAVAPVTSVNTKTGAVVLAASDVGAIATGGAVTTVNGKTGTSVSITAADVGAVPVQNPVNLTDGATIATDVSTGRYFRVTLGGNRTLGNPTGSPTDGQTALWEFTQDSTGGRTLSLGSQFKLGTDISSVVLSTTAGTKDFLGAVYNAALTEWQIICFVRGY